MVLRKASTWQLFSNAGGEGFRWETSGRILAPDAGHEPIQNLDPTPPLPSMADLLIQECSKLIGREEDGGEKLPTFRACSGNSVALEESSIARDLSILGDDTVAHSGCTLSPKRDVGAAGKLPMFRTGLGKSVALKDSSVAKALSILGDDNVDNSGAFLPRQNGFCSSNSLFQTGNGKTVNVSPAAVVRAKALLGLEEEELNRFNHVKKLSSSNQPLEQEFLAREKISEANNQGELDAASFSRHSTPFKSNFRLGLMRTTTEYKVCFASKQSELSSSASKAPPVKFQTAGGKLLTVSSDALKRAKSLLGDPELENFVDPDNQFLTPLKETRTDGTPLIKGNSVYAPLPNPGRANSGHTSNSFVSPLRSSSKQFRSLVNSENLASGSNLIKKFDAVINESDFHLTSTRPAIQEALCSSPSTSVSIVNSTVEDVFGSRIKGIGRPNGGILSDVTNRSGTAYANGEKKRLGQPASVSPFKRPRNSRFSTPLKKNVQHVPSGLSTVSSEHFCSKRVLSTRYPVNVPRIYLKEYFGVPPLASTWVSGIKSNNADKHVFADEFGSKTIGAEAFFQMLAESGASTQHASKEWVTNHYRWIVWKLACYERSYPAKSAGNFLTIHNVLEELQYRYEREVNHGHRSAIKRILAGDAPAARMLVLCISTIPSNSRARIDNTYNATVELTDGWYSVDAFLDAQLTKQLTAGKLFVGQKLRIWGAGMCGWAGPTSPLEASRTVSFLLNINGTYRAHWAERLGFCKGTGAPLAFSCIKSDGGPVPRTLAGITRIYPILYKERLRTGKSVVRTERMESKMMQLHSQRRSALVEGIISEYHAGVDGFHNHNDFDSEGAKIYRLLETAAEPEFIMAEMSREQLASFVNYKEKLEASRQAEVEKSIEKALQDAGLGERGVTPFMRIRVVGLTATNYLGKHKTKEGIVTIWNPTEKLKTELAEGQICIIEGLSPTNTDSGTLYLQARGSTTKWQPVTSETSENFRPFFNPRKSVALSNLGEVPISSEFDIAAFVVHIGEVYADVQQKKQWLFVTDGSVSRSKSGETSNHLLAICYCSAYMDENLLPLINYNLAESTVGFCNLIKRSKDQANDLWIAEATENSSYCLSFDSPNCSHLKSTGDSARAWAKISRSAVNKLREKVSFILGDCKE